MKSPTVSLYLRPILPNGKRPYLEPVYTGRSGQPGYRLKPQWAEHNGEPTHSRAAY